MAKILLRDKALRVQFDDTYPNKFNETSYFNTTISDDGVSIIIANDQDPNFVDVVIAYADISFPLTGSITELVDLIRTVILSKNGLLTVYNESTDVVTNTLGLQNVGGDLYWNGTLLSGGGGGNVVTADNGLNFTGGNPNNITLGGTLLYDTAVEAEGYNLMFRGVDPFSGRDARVAINATSGAAKMASDSDGVHIGWDAALNKVLIQSGSLENVTITNDGTNNVVLDPTSLDVNHNTLIRLQFNELASKASTISMDNVESVFNYTNTATGAISQHSLNDSYWTASYQSANLANIQLDDYQVRLLWQGGSTADLSTIVAEAGDITLENTDGSDVAQVFCSGQNGIRLTLTDNFTLDYNRLRILPSGVSLEASINGGNVSTLSVLPDVIIAEGGFTQSIASIPLTTTTLPPKKNFYFIDTTGAPGAFTLTIPVENCFPGYEMTIKDETGLAGTRTMLIDTNLGTMEYGTPVVINQNGGFVKLVYTGSVWLVVNKGAY